MQHFFFSKRWIPLPKDHSIHTADKKPTLIFLHSESHFPYKLLLHLSIPIIASNTISSRCFTTMSMVPGRCFGGRSSLHEPFFQQVWDPFQEFHYGGTRVAPRPAFSTESPFELSKLDWKETPEAYVFRADLPGLKKNEVRVEVEDGRVLCISGEKCLEKEEKGELWHLVERSSGSFVRRFRLPENAKIEKLTAYLENGVLTVTVPKEEAKHHPKRTIQINGM